MTNAIHPVPSLSGKLMLLAQDIKLSHTIFAMPWALLATFHAAHGFPKPGQIGLIVVCMIFARTFAMGMNRLLDATLDAINPRTSGRAIPSGRLPTSFMWMVVVACAVGFTGATLLFGTVYHNFVPVICSLPVLIFIGSYPLLKRFTRLCHYYLGAALALAPICAWVAITGRLSIEPTLMAASVLLWTAGFDILYACQDYQSDLTTGTFSIPSKFGIPIALWIARCTHLFCIFALILLGHDSQQLGNFYFSGVGIAILLLIIEHAIVKPTDLSKLNLAFFTINGLISLIISILGICDILSN